MVQAVIIAAGLGSRLYPITDVIPKIMMPVGENELPLAHLIIDHCKKHGINDFVFCLNRKSGKQIENYLGDGSRFSCSIKYSYSETPMGTAGEVKLAYEYGLISTPCLIYYGDTLCKTDITYLMEYHKKMKADISITINDNIRIPTGYVKDVKGIISKITEKPKLINIGGGGILPIFYIDNEDFFIIYCRNGYDIVSDVFTFMKQNNYKLVAYHDSRPFLDLGDWKNYERAKEWEN